MRFRLVLAAALAALSVPAAAEPAAVAGARAAGLVGERYDGYIGVAGPISPAVRSAVGQVNITRRSLYADLAARRGVLSQEIGITAGCALLAATPIGGAYMLQDNEWRRRDAEDAAPRPAYCR